MEKKRKKKREEKSNEIFFFKQKTAYEIKECDWSSDVCSSDLAREKFAKGKEVFTKERKGKKGAYRKDSKPELTEEDVQKQIKETLARLSDTSKSKSAKYRKQKREAVSEALQKELEEQEKEKKLLKVTEFVSANELALLMDVSVNEIISSCMELGIFVSINQRLNAETLSIVAEEFGYQVEFVNAEGQEEILEEADDPQDLLERTPIVTVMGHVDHGKTSLLDFIRNSNIIGGEAGGITQHIGAYEVTLENEKKIAFLDTPGHEAFTAMRARGAQVTDIVIIVVAADDSVMPQTVEAINHAQAANVPIVFAINKIDKPNANPDNVRQQLSKLNLVSEEWGGDTIIVEVSAKKGIGIEKLLEMILIQSEMMNLVADPEIRGQGVVVDGELEKGRGPVVTVLIQKGTCKVGDPIVAGIHYGHVRSINNNKKEKLLSDNKIGTKYIGKKDFEDQVLVSLYNSALGIDQNVTFMGDLDAGDMAQVTFTFNVPSGMTEKQYNLEMSTYYDYDVDDAEYDEASKDTFIFPLKVEGNCIQPEATMVASLESGGQAGDALVVRATITNSGLETSTYTFGVTGYSTWASTATINKDRKSVV